MMEKENGREQQASSTMYKSECVATIVQLTLKHGTILIRTPYGGEARHDFANGATGEGMGRISPVYFLNKFYSMEMKSKIYKRWDSILGDLLAICSTEITTKFRKN